MVCLVAVAGVRPVDAEAAGDIAGLAVCPAGQAERVAPERVERPSEVRVSHVAQVDRARDALGVCGGHCLGEFARAELVEVVVGVAVRVAHEVAAVGHDRLGVGLRAGQGRVGLGGRVAFRAVERAGSHAVGVGLGGGLRVRGEFLGLGLGGEAGRLVAVDGRIGGQAEFAGVHIPEVQALFVGETAGLDERRIQYAGLHIRGVQIQQSAGQVDALRLAVVRQTVEDAALAQRFVERVHVGLRRRLRGLAVRFGLRLGCGQRIRGLGLGVLPRLRELGRIGRVGLTLGLGDRRLFRRVGVRVRVGHRAVGILLDGLAADGAAGGQAEIAGVHVPVVQAGGVGETAGEHGVGEDAFAVG